VILQITRLCADTVTNPANAKKGAPDV
jgi:hypothetical protein